MKKLIALFLALLTVLTFAACGTKTDDSDDEHSGSSETSDENGMPEFRLPENVQYRFKSNEDYTDLTVTKIGDEWCIENIGQITFYRKNSNGQYDSWLRIDDDWMALSSFDEATFSVLLGISTVGLEYDSLEKIGTDTVCGISVDVYKSKYLPDYKTYVHSGKDGVFVAKTVVGSSVVEIIEWDTKNVEFTVSKPQ